MFKIHIIITLLLLVVLSCSKQSQTSAFNHQQTAKYFSDTLIFNASTGAGIGAPYAAEYFPNRKGNRWTYKVTDSLHARKYQVTVQVIGNTNGTKKWVFIYPDEKDTQPVVSQDKYAGFLPEPHISAYYNPPFMSLGLRLEFPLYRGKQWQYLPYATQARVTGLDTLTQNNFGYPGQVKVFTLQISSGGGTEYGGVFTIHFAPNIGLISMDRYVFDRMPVVREHWQLMSYQLQGPPLVKGN
jgi:hypothetical protein